MACRINRARFQAMAQQEAAKIRLTGPTETDAHTDTGAPDNLVEVVGETAVLHRKAIQSLVDEAEQARPIILNLLRWAKEHGAMRHTLISWMLMVAAGGAGMSAVSHAPVPVAIFNTMAACDIARGKKIAEYRQFLAQPIRSGYDYIEGVVAGWPASRQLYILTCEQTRGR